jgi:hypothetical protein
MKRLLLSAAAVSLMGLAPMVAFAGNSGYTAGLGIAGAIGSNDSTSTYGSVDGGGSVTGKGTVYATSQSSNNEGAQQSFGLTGSQTSSYSTEQGSGYVKSGNDGKGGVDYAAGGDANAAGGYGLAVEAYGTEYENNSGWGN